MEAADRSPGVNAGTRGGRYERFEDAFGTVLLLALATYAAWSLLDFSGWPGVIVVAVACATGVMALIAADARPGLIPIAVGLAALAVVLALVAAATDEETWLSIASLLGIVLLGGAIGAMLVRILLASKVGVEPILGALSVYGLLGIVFAFVYATVNRAQDGLFFTGIEQPEASDFVFFSYTTLTTTGYGNLVPDGQPGQMIAGLEMLIGQIFLVTLIARLVALWKPGEKLRAARAARGEGDQ